MSYVIGKNIYDLVIELYPQPKTQMKVFDFLSILTNNQAKNIENYKPFYSKSIQKLLGNNYREILRLLRYHSVIQRTYYTEKKCFDYRVNPAYLYWNELIIVPKTRVQNFKPNDKKAIRDLNRLTFDFSGILQEIEKSDNPNKINICNYVARFVDKRFYAHRNRTNYRLDTNLTTLPKNLLKFISLDGEPLLELDVRNSQFAFFSYLLNDIQDVVSKFPHISCYTFPDIDNTKDDYNRFIQDSLNGILYDGIAADLDISRIEAKKQMLQYFFSANQSHSTVKKHFKLKYPTIYKWIIDFKRINESNQFSIMLQRMESSLFIDVIYAQLKKILRKKERLIVFTKHDAVIMKESDYDIVKSTVIKIFTDYNFKCTII